MHSVESNLRKLKLLVVFQDAMAVIPVIVLYLQDNGLTLAQAFQLQAIFSVALLVMEVPSGYLSDRWGRKPTLVAGSAFGLVGACVYAAGSQFWHFAAAEMLLAVVFAFHSGTVEALTKESLLAVNRAHEFRKTMRVQSSLAMTSQAVAGIIGGFLATFSLRLPFVLEIVAFICALAVTLRLVEPSRHIVSEAEETKSMWKVFQYTLSRHSSLRGIILAGSTISLLTLMLFWFTQPYQQLVELPLALFGLSHAVMVLGAVGANVLAGRLEHG
ncbi:MAG: MFS transporter [Candidatus Andersenbacteria bacterium]